VPGEGCATLPANLALSRMLKGTMWTALGEREGACATELHPLRIIKPEAWALHVGDSWVSQEKCAFSFSHTGSVLSRGNCPWWATCRSRCESIGKHLAGDRDGGRFHRQGNLPSYRMDDAFTLVPARTHPCPHVLHVRAKRTGGVRGSRGFTTILLASQRRKARLPRGAC
jgi:hypothetical protein